MAGKQEYLSLLYQQTVEDVTNNYENWTAFLRSACRNYKCPFHEQVLIHAQRPDATAVLELRNWNSRFGRWVNSGSTGIGVLDLQSNGRTGIKYYFDISDTHEGRYSKPVPVWELRREYAGAVIETLENSFGELDNSDSLAAALISAANNTVSDNLPDYLSQMLEGREGSLLADLSEAELENAVKTVLCDAVAYMLLTRCGLDAEEYLNSEDKLWIPLFHTAQTATIIGTAASDIAEPVLKEIASTVLELQKDEKNQVYTFANSRDVVYPDNVIQNEGRTDYDLHDGERLSDSERGAARPAGQSPWEIRPASLGVPQEPPKRDLRELPDELHSGGASARNRQDGAGEINAADHTTGSDAGRDGGSQGTRSDEVGRNDEQHTELGGGNDFDGAGLQLNGSLPTEAEQIRAIEEAADEKSAAPLRSGYISQQIIDEILCDGTNDTDSKLRICAQYRRDKTSEENIAFLKKEYAADGKGFILDGEKVSVWFGENGIVVALGDTALNSPSNEIISWAQMDKRIRELLELGRYMPKSELDKVEIFERNSLAAKLWYLHQDRDDEYFADHAFFMDEEIFKGGFPDSTARIADLLAISEEVEKLAEGLREFCDAYDKEPALLRFHFHKPKELLQRLLDLQITPVEFKSEMVDSPTHAMFITQDEIDNRIMLGNRGHNSKYDIYFYFREIHSAQEKVDFLKKGIILSGSSFNGFSDTRDAKGIVLSRGSRMEPYAKVTVSWSKVAVRIQELIDADVYLSAEEKEKIPDYLERIENGKIRAAKIEAIDAAAKLPPAEKRDTLTSRLADFLNFLEPYEKSYLEKHGLLELADTNAAQIEELLRNPQKTEQLMAALSAINGATCGIFERNNAWKFGEELSSLFTRQHVYNAGDTVYLGSSQYEVVSFNDSIVCLFDEGFPLLNKEMPRAEFERMIRENPLNEHLLKIVGVLENAAEPQAAEFIETETNVDDEKVSIIIGTQLTINLDSQPEKENGLSAPSFHRPKTGGRVQNFDLHPEIPQAQRHNFHIEDDRLGHGGAKEKFRANMDAIRVLKTVEGEDRFATPEEQTVLSKYVGWGGLSDAFDETKAAWASEYSQLQAALSSDEYAAARESSLTAFYTPPIVIKAMYTALENMGFKAGNVLEPSCGVGNFMGLAPDSMRDCKFFGVELDSVSGRIAQQLYQKNNIAVQGFEKMNLPDSFFDVAVGNVPFGDFSVADKRYDKNKFKIHDFFFAKTLDKVRPGGVVAFITSKGTLDKQNPAVRKYIAQRADLLGAVRLPDNTFTANAGTRVTSDIIFLQKRDRIIDIEPEWVHLGLDENGISMNQYFIDHPEKILGNMVMESTAYGFDSACKAEPDSDFSDLLSSAVSSIHAEILDYRAAELADEEDLSIPADLEVRNFSYAKIDGRIYFRENSRMYPVDLPVTTLNRVKGLIDLRECVRTLMEYQTEDYPDEAILAEQTKLNSLYDSFTKKYGLISSRANSSAFSDDSAYFLLCSLEILDENGALLRKADMFAKRTIKAQSVVSAVDTASEALAVSISEKACVDIPFMVGLMGGEEKTAEIISELQGVIFRNPLHEYNPTARKFLTADEYLSGNIREKLEWARQAAAQNPDDYTVNVEALEAVLPPDLSASEISVRLGATWLPPETVQAFLFELLSTPRYRQWNIKVHYTKLTAQWNIEGKSRDTVNIKAMKTYGTDRINAYKIIEETLNLRDVRIFDTVYEADGSKKRVLNKKETTIAQQKQEAIKSAFDEWIWKDPERRNRLVRLYNDQFNSLRPREYDGSHISFSGMNPEIVLRPHQKNAAARTLYGGNSLYAHVVGAGKTFTMVAAAQEGKRLGLCNKSLFVVPNHLTEQWASEYLQLYPSANILVATKKDFETKNRKKFCGRIATGDYDAVIIGHSQFEKIPMSLERQRTILERQLEELLGGIAELKSQNAERFTVKQLEKTRKSIQLKLDKLNDQSRKDDVVTFEELGVDRLFVDEAHYYKNLFLYTKMRNVGGIAQTEAQKSSDLFMKCRYLDELTGGKGIVFATGTPISNSMVELYTMQRYLQYGALEQHSLQHFDAWASTFGETVTAIELAPEGSGYRAKTRFAKFYNLPELMNMFREVADIQTADMLNLPVPKANYHNVALKPTEFQKELVENLSVRADDVRNKRVEPHIDNMLKITNDGRKLALDQRLINEMLPDSADSKVDVCAGNVCELWERHGEKKLTQLVFCDLSTPHYDGSFNVYDDLKKKLTERGIPAEEVAFIHDAKSEVQKKDMFARVRSGQLRVLIGSTQKMGAGTNVQDKLIALHDLDCPWRPSDLEQRSGRIVRQGNANPEVEIFRYVTEGTFDAYLYQLVENKQKFISQIMTSKSPVRSAEDIDETALSYAEIKALATGNPYIKEKMDLDMQVARLRVIKSSYLDSKYALEDAVLKKYPQEIRLYEERVEGFVSDISVVTANMPAKNTPTEKEPFPPMTIHGKTYTKKEDAGKAILAATQTKDNPAAEVLGAYRGFAMELLFESGEWHIVLKNRLRFRTALGTDVFGNITRLDNVLESLGSRLENCRETLANTRNQMENAREEAARPFPQEQELQEKSARLDELNILLNMDKKEDRESAVFDGEAEQEDTQEKKRAADAR